MRMNNRYDEIINLPHHVSKTRPQMPMSDRAAQFAPFAALTGYDSAIKETGRLTDERIELDEEALTALDMKYQLLMDAFDDAPEVTITYFQPDERKAGGKYVSAVGAVKKIDDFERRITMQDGAKIPMDDVLSIEGELVVAFHIFPPLVFLIAEIGPHTRNGKILPVAVQRGQPVVLAGDKPAGFIKDGLHGKLVMLKEKILLGGSVVGVFRVDMLECCQPRHLLS